MQPRLVHLLIKVSSSLANDCLEDGEIGGELGPVLGGSHGCVRVIPKGVLYWGTAEDADPDDTDNVGLKIDDDVTQIIAIVGENLYTTTSTVSGDASIRKVLDLKHWYPKFSLVPTQQIPSI